MMSEEIKKLNIPPDMPTQKEAFWYWLKLRFVSFGGPGGQISIMHHDLVEKNVGYLKSDFYMRLIIVWCYLGQRRNN